MSKQPYHFTGTPRLYGAIHDAVIAFGVFVIAHAIVLGASRAFAVSNFWYKAAGFTLVASAVFYVFSLNRGSWRYASMPDLLAIIKAALTLAVLYTIGVFIAERGVSLPRSVPFLIAAFLVVGLSASRMVYRLYRENGLHTLFPEIFNAHEADRRLVLVHTLNDAADLFVRASRTAASSNGPIVVGLLDERPEKTAQQIQGVRVLGGIGELAVIMDKLAYRGIQVEEIVIADSTMAPAALSRIAETAIALGLRVSKLPDIGSRKEVGTNDVLDLKPIRLVDLLGRKETVIDTTGTAKLISGKVVLITGSGGSIGSELARQIARFEPKRLILSENSEFHLYKIGMELREIAPGVAIDELIVDVRDRSRVFDAVKAAGPDVIFHAAALKHVPIVEDNPAEGIKTNVLGTCNMADAAVEHGVRTFVMISTDKAVNPTNIMGATKRAAEAYCQSLDVESAVTRFKTVRFGNVLGSNGSVVPLFQKQIARGGPVTVTHPEIVRFFMSIPEAVRLVLQASGHGLAKPAQRGRILVLDMGDPVKIDDLARKMILLAGFKPGVDIKIAYTGLRPGEKLYEELFDDSEIVERDSGAGYAMAAPRAISRKMMLRAIGEMRAACAAEDDATAIALLRKIVPEYQPSPANPALPEASEKSAKSPAAAQKGAANPPSRGIDKLH